MSTRRAWLYLSTLLFLALPASATWSIVCVNLKTREVAVASATCLENFNLKVGVPVVVVGEGAAAAQSFVDLSGENRRTIFLSFRDSDETPLEILAELAAQDTGHQTRQYGIVNFTGDPVTFTGRQAGLAATGVTGRVGDILYAIQGNVLTGDEVVFAAEEAFRNTKGDVGQKLMAAMEGARAFGGDGRCSCRPNAPTSCGAPPPEFEKSAHVGVVVVARIGDSDGVCNAIRGCATGQYYLTLNVVDGQSDPDPVFTLQERYDVWREARLGRPDGILSRVEPVQELPADGLTERTVVVRLRDLDDLPLTRGGAQVEVTTVDGLPSLATIGPVVDRGDGSYAFTLRAGTEVGVDRLRITAADDLVRATLFPFLEVATVAAGLHVGLEEVSAAGGALLPFVVNEPERPRSHYWIAARLDPTVADPMRAGRGGRPVLLSIGESPFFPGPPGRLDEGGRAEASLEIPPGALTGLVGLQLQFEAWMNGHGKPGRTNTVEVGIGP